mmetsp:Transcript_34406/g.79424  ORF Transcript_34406/g.79424 Transcript_34406/m.79424 type:complete len:213 (+) Transcript_34406:41-679(+)
MFFSIIYIIFVQIGFFGKDIFRDESPDGNIGESHALKQFRSIGHALVGGIDKHFEFHNAGTFHHDSTQMFDERHGRCQGPSRGHQIINDQNPIALLDLVPLDRQTFPVAVFRLVGIGLNGIGHFAFFPHHHEGFLQCQCNGRTQHESSCIQTRNTGDILAGITGHENVDDLLKDGWFVKKSSNVIESRDSLEWEEWEILGNLSCRFIILFVF